MDLSLYEDTLDSQATVNPCINKEVLYVQDQNGGSYNGQVTFDTSVLGNSGMWLAYSEAYLEIPFVCTLKVDLADAKDEAAALAAETNAFLVGLKNGSHQLIDSIQVDYNNTNVIQLQPFTNFYVSYKMMTSFSTDDVTKFGPTLNFNPDTSTSFSFNAASNTSGDGYSNNRVYPLTAPVYGGAAIVYDGYNKGYAQRLKDTSFGVGPNVRAGYGSIPTIATQALCNSIGKSHVGDNAEGTTALRVIQWSILATIRLKDIADFFDKLPLIKGGFMRIILNYNSSRTVFTTAGGPPATGIVMGANAITMTSGRTNPILITSAAANNPAAPLLAAATNGQISVTVNCGIKQTSNSFSTPPIQSCRLYVPAYSLNAVYEDQLLRLKPTKEVIYTDVYNYNIVNVARNTSFNAILTNGIVNPKYVVVIPYANSSAAGVFAAFRGAVYQSPFDTAPATTTPMAAITQFNVQVGGKNVFQQNFQYDFESFMNEVASANAINGGSTVGLSNGLIGKSEWDNGYRYYVADVSRRDPANNLVPQSITVQGLNNTDVPMDYICFIVFERKITIKMDDGSLLAPTV